MPVDLTNPARPYAAAYAQHYWSGGAAEKEHVFLGGCRILPQLAALLPGSCLTVAEVGFGTGLTFLLTLRAFHAHAAPGARLDYFACEKHPLSAAEILQIQAHQGLAPQLVEALLGVYAPRPGWNRWSIGAATLHLFVGEALDALAGWQKPADAWFLDGFSPAHNPEAWSGKLLVAIFNHMNPKGILSTYSAAGSVKQALRGAGFQLSRQAGFPPKRHMLVAVKQL